jgi:hypothetical protein
MAHAGRPIPFDISPQTFPRPRNRWPMSAALACAALLGACAVDLKRPEAEQVRIEAVRAEVREGPRHLTAAQLRDANTRFVLRALDKISEAYDKIELTAKAPAKRRLALENKLAFIRSALNIAIAPDPAAGLLDLTVLVSLARMAAEEVWVNEFPEHAKSLRSAFRAVEADAWMLAGRILDAKQQQELRQMIAEWRARHPADAYVEGVRFGDFVEASPKSELAAAVQQGGLLAGVAHAAQTVDEVRLLSERLLLYLQLAPALARLEAKAGVYDVLAQPEIREAMGDFKSFTRSAARYADVLEQPKIQEAMGDFKSFTHSAARYADVLERLPATLAGERQAWTALLATNRAPLRDLLTELRSTLEAGQGLGVQLDKTLRTADGVADRLDLRTLLHAQPTGGGDIRAYREMLAESQQLTQEMVQFLERFDQVLRSPGWNERFPQMLGAVERVGREGEGVMRHGFVLGGLLIGLWLIGFVLARLAYEFLARRIFGRSSSPTQPTG